MLETTVLYWNVGNSKAAMEQVIDGQREYDIIAIQEPWRNPDLRTTTYWPRSDRYHIIYAGDGSRSALLVHKRHSVSRWEAKATPDWCRVQIRTDDGNTLSVYSIYSPIPNRTGDNRRWSSPIHHFQTLRVPSRTALVGDFNLHHPSWDRHGRRTAGVEDLLTLSTSWDLELLAPWGEPTRTKHRDRDSTIDHAWVTRDLRAVYEGPEDYSLSDHRPQVIKIQIGASTPPDPKGYHWKLMDTKRVAAEAVHLGRATELRTPQEIDEQCDYLIKELQHIAAVSTPRRKKNHGRVTEWWNREVGVLRTETRPAERRWRAARTQRAWEDFQNSQKYYRKAIASAKRESWRRVLQEASNDPRQAWALARWGRQRSHLPPDPSKIPSLRPNPEAEPTAFTHAEKTETLRRRFFPDIATGDAHTSPIRANPQFEVDDIVTPDQVERAIQRTGTWKAPGQDGLPTGFLKACAELLYKALARITQASL
jgi:hypothetical protein